MGESMTLATVKGSMVRVALLACLTTQVFGQVATPDDLRLHGAVKRMFDAGIGPNRSAAELQAAYNFARRIGPGDPRVTYAWALFQYRRMKRDEAMQLFSGVARQAAEPYFPAWQTHINLLLMSSKSRTKGLSEIKALAQQLTTAKAPATRIERVAMAGWVSEVLAAVKKTTAREADIKAVEATEQQVREQFDAAGISESWEAGRLATEHRFKKIKLDDKAQSEVKQQKARIKAANTINKIDKRLDDISVDSATSELGKADLNAAVREKLDEISDEFKRLERAYELLDQQARDVHTSLGEAIQDLANYKIYGTTSPRRTSRPDPPDASNRRLWRLQREAGEWQVRYGSLVDEANAVVRQAHNLAAHRNRVVQEFQRRTGQIVKQQINMSKWTSRLKDRKEKTAHGSKEAKQPRRISFRTLMSFDMNTERERLLATLKPVQNDGD